MLICLTTNNPVCAIIEDANPIEVCTQRKKRYSLIIYSDLLKIIPMLS